MTTRKAIYLLAAVLISGCGDDDTADAILPLPTRDAASVSMERVEEKAAATPREILSRFLQDIQMCKQLIEEIKNDQAFIESFHPLDARKRRTYVNFVRESSFADTPAAQYVVLNHEYLDLGVDYHEVPWAVARTPDSSIYCATTLARLQEIESLGESPEGWEIRKFFLDGALSSLLHPSMDMTDGFTEFYELESLVQEAVDLYRGPQRPSLHAWLEKAIRQIEDSRRDVSPESGRLTLAEQHAELDRSIDTLRRVLNP